MAGLNDRRILGTESGALRRAARMVQRNGGNPSALLQRAADAKLGEGSAISSSEENINFEDKKRRTVAGINESRRRAVLGGDNTQKFNADLDSSALIKTDPAARQRAYDRGASLGVSREQIDQRAGLLPKPTGTAPAQTGTTPAQTGTTPAQRATADVRSTDPQIPGLTATNGMPPYDRGKATTVAPPASGATMPLSTGTAPAQTGTAPAQTGTAPALSRPTLQGPPISAKPGLIDGKAAGSVLAGMRPTETEPGNMAGITDRETKDRESAITAARTGSADNPNVTRQGVIDRINKERVAGGRQPFGEDIYKDIAKIDGDEAAGKQAVKTEIGRQTALQKSLADAKTRFAPPPAEIQGPPSSAKPAEFQGPPASAKPAASLSPAPQGLGPRFSSGASITTPEAVAQRKDASLQDFRKKKRDAYNKEWNAVPDLPVAAPDSALNKSYKSVRTFLSGKSY